jgi:hypothetical protein
VPQQRNRARPPPSRQRQGQLPLRGIASRREGDGGVLHLDRNVSAARNGPEEIPRRSSRTTRRAGIEADTPCGARAMYHAAEVSRLTRSVGRVRRTLTAHGWRRSPRERPRESPDESHLSTSIRHSFADFPATASSIRSLGVRLSTQDLKRWTDRRTPTIFSTESVRFASI